MKKIFYIIMALMIVISNAPTVLAYDNSNVKEPIIVEGHDTFFQIDDMGIYDLINSINDPIKK